MYDFVAKDSQINFRVRPALKADLEAIAEFHGLTVSSYVHSVLVKAVRREREAMPDEFEQPKPMRQRAPVLATITPAGRQPASKADVQRMIDEGDVAEIHKRLKSTKTQTVPVLKKKVR